MSEDTEAGRCRESTGQVQTLDLGKGNERISCSPMEQSI